MSGIYSGNGGPGTVLAAKLAVEDFGGKVLGRPIEVVSADHQSKPDIGSALARQFIEQQGVSAIIPGGASSVGLAVQALASSLKKTTLVSGGYASSLAPPAAAALRHAVGALDQRAFEDHRQGHC